MSILPLDFKMPALPTFAAMSTATSSSNEPSSSKTVNSTPLVSNPGHMQMQAFSPTITLNQNPSLESSGALVTKWLNNQLNASSIKWGEKFLQAVDRVVQAKAILDKNIETLNQLLQKEPPKDVHENLKHRKEIEQAAHKIALSTTDLYKLVRKAQDKKDENKPWVFNRDCKIEATIEATDDTYLKPLKNKLIPDCRNFIAQIGTQNHLGMQFLEAFSFLTTPWEDFNDIYTAITSPQTSENERANLLEKLKATRDSARKMAGAALAPSGAGPKFSLTQEQNNQLQGVVDEVHRNMDALFEEADFYAKPTTDNSQKINDLRLEGRTSEYLYFSSLFAKKLLDDNQPDECINFTNEWMQNGKAGAPTSSVLQIGNAFLVALQKKFQENTGKSDSARNGVDLSFCKDFNEWWMAHPEHQITQDQLRQKDPASEFNDSEHVELLRGNLTYLQGKEPTYQDMECFQNCDELSPSPHWKVKHGEFFISVYEWDTTKRIIDILPPESALELKLKLSWNQYHTASTVMNLATCAFPMLAQLAPEGKCKTALHLVNIPIQAGCNPLIARSWLTNFVSFPEELRNSAEFLNSPTNALDLFYLFRAIVPTIYPLIDRHCSVRVQQICNKWLKPGLALVSDSSIALGGAITIILDPKFHQVMFNGWEKRLLATDSISLIFQTCTSAVSFACFGNRSIKKRVSPVWRAAEETAQTVTSHLAPITLAYRSKDVVYYLTKRYVPVLVSGPLGTAITVTLTVAQVVDVAHQVGLKFPHRKTAHFLMDAHELCMAGEYEKAKTLFQSAKDEWIIKESTVKVFFKCLDFFKLLPHLQPTPGSRAKLATSIRSVNEALTALKTDDAYEQVRNDLIVNKVSAYLKCEDTENAKNALTQEPLTTSVKASIVSFLVSHAQGLVVEKKYDTACSQLRTFADIESLKDYKPLIDNYQKYIHARKNTPEVKPETAEETIRLLVASLDHTIKETEGNPHFSGVALNLNAEKAYIYLAAHKYPNVNEVINSRNVHSGIYAKVADHLIRSAMNMAEAASYERAYEYLKNANNNLTLSKEFQKMISQAVAYFNLRKGHKILVLPDLESKALMKAIDEFLASLKEHLPHLEPFLQADRAIIFTHQGKLTIAGLIIKNQKQFLHNKLTSYFADRIKKNIDQKQYPLANDRLRRMALLNAQIQPNPLKIDDLVAQHVIKNALIHYKNQNYAEALRYLTDAMTLDFHHKNLISKYKEHADLCLQHKSTFATKAEDANQFITAIDSILSQIPDNELLASIKTDLRHDKFLSCLSGKKYIEAKALIGNRAPILEDSAAMYFLMRIGTYISQGKYEDAIAYIQETNALPFKHRDLITKYREYVICLKDQNGTIPSENVQITRFIAAIDSILFKLPEQEFFAPIRTQLRRMRMLSCINAQRYNEANTILQNQVNTFDNDVTFSLMVKINSLIKAKNYDDALAYITDVAQISFLNQDLIANHREYIICLKELNGTIPDQEAQATRFIAAIDSVLEKIPDTGAFAHFRVQLKEIRLLSCLGAKNYPEASAMFRDKSNDFDDSAAIYLLDKINSLINQSKYDEALVFIEEIQQLEFKHLELISKHKKYINCLKIQNGDLPNQKAQATQFIEKINEVLNGLAQINQLDRFANPLKHYKLLTALNIDDFVTVKAVMAEDFFATDQLRKNLSLNLIIRGEIQRKRLDAGSVADYIKKVVDLCDLSQDPNIKIYRKFLEESEDFNSFQFPDDEAIVLRMIRLIDAMSEGLGNTHLPLSLNETKINLYIQLGQFYQSKQQLTEAISCFDSATRGLPPGNEELGDGLQKNILMLKKRLRQTTDKKG